MHTATTFRKDYVIGWKNILHQEKLSVLQPNFVALLLSSAVSTTIGRALRKIISPTVCSGVRKNFPWGGTERN